MIKKLLLVLAFFSLIVFGVNRGLHRNYLEDAEAAVVLSMFAGQFEVNMFTEYAPLPDRDRAIISKLCEPIHKQVDRLRGTKSRLDPKEEPECQALIRSGWRPNWTLDDGVTFLRTGL